jgi:predicted SAM-dependent methyltransferase
MQNLINFFKKDSAKVSDRVFLEMAYQVILEREIEPAGLEIWSNQLKLGLTRLDLVKALINSPEFAARCNPDAFFNAIHNPRLKLVQTLLPEAEVILDLGGAHSGDPKGALLNFGYPYLPKKLYILDLPPSDRMFPAAEVPTKLRYDSCEIEYVYRSMSDLACFEEASFDLIWSGESIEHITPDEAEKVFAQVHKLLKPNGKFALDTPNRRVTKLQCPNSYIHPEHKIEYYYDDLINSLEKHNFKIVETKGLIELPESISKSTFLVEEAIKNSDINDNPQDSYMFYVCCMPTA